MSILDSLKKYFKTKRLDKLEKDLMSLRSRLNFDPRRLIGNYDAERPEAFSRRIMEYKIWSMGNAMLIRRFYAVGKQDADGTVKLNYFWATAPSTTRMIHSGIPGLISSYMPDILFGGGINTNVVIYKSDGESLAEDKAAEKKANEFLDNLCGIMNLHAGISKAATVESWGGHCFFKYSHDSELSDFPILEAFDITEAETVKVRGIVKAIIFKKWYSHKNDSYRLDEIYSTNAVGDATIQYRLFKLEPDREREVNLLSIPDTVKLFSVDGAGAGDFQLDGNGTFTYTGLKGMLAFEKPNKMPSLEFPSSNYGASDYEGAIDSFDALDEVYSGNIGEVRANKTKKYVPETMLPVDNNGNPLPFDEYADCYVKVKSDSDQNAKNEIVYQKVEDKTDSFNSKERVAITKVCNKAKISPSAIGMSWLESVGPSAESQRERKSLTFDMRKDKLELWKPMLEEMLLRGLQLNSWMRSNTDVMQDAFTDYEYNWDNTTVQVIFGEYEYPAQGELIDTWGNAKSLRVASTAEAVKNIHPEWTDKQVNDEVNLIKFEDGMTTDNPMNLPTLSGLEDGEGDNE